MRSVALFAVILSIALCVSAFSAIRAEAAEGTDAPYTRATRIDDVARDPVFGNYGRLIFPVDRGYMSGETLGTLRLAWYSCIDPDKTVEIANYLKSRAAAGEQVFIDIYAEAEKRADARKRDTGLFFFRGRRGAPFAVCCAGGGFAYVGAMHDSFPHALHALELSKMGYNAFAIIYRPGAQAACEDLARAISVIFANAEKLGVSTEGYSLWGGSAGARMAAWLGSAAPRFRERKQEAVSAASAAVVMQYTGHSDYTRNDPPTYACVGENDGIASWRAMERRIEALRACGIETEFHHYAGLSHGFGLGTGTIAEGWIDDAAAFWQKQIDKNRVARADGAK